MVTKLQHVLRRPRHQVEAHDVSAAFLRRARERFGERMPLAPVGVVRGALRVSCPSPLWRLELLYSADALLTALHRDLSEVALRRMTPILR